MNGEEILKVINSRIEQTPLDSVLYEDAFSCIRNIGEESNKIQVEKTHELMNKIYKAMEIAKGSGNAQFTNKIFALNKKCLIYAAPDCFDDFMLALEINRPMQSQFWLPRRRLLMPVCEALQQLETGDLQELFLSLPPRVGKALADDTPVLTRNGWKNHGDLKIGDEVIGMNGEFKKVIAVLPKCNLDILIEFTNGEKIQCHENHEWLFYDRNKQANVLKETHEYEKQKLDSGILGVRGHRYRFQVPKHNYIVGEEKKLPLNPYFLGVWLGDGENKQPRIANAENDNAIIEKIVKNGYKIRWSTKHKTTGVMYYDFDIRKELQSMGMCYSRKSVSKYIPDIYLTASIEQRLQLLAGLLDTDGTYNQKEKRYHFSTSEPKLKDGFVQLISTFGWRASVAEYGPKISSSGIIGRKKIYQIGFCPDCEIPCELKRKQNHEFAMRRAIGVKSIKRVAPKQGNCITVEGDGMYLAGKTMLPTHNTTVVMMFVLWIMGRNSERTNLYCSFSEKTVNPFYTGILEVLNDTVTYDFFDVFPSAKLVQTNANENKINLDRIKRYASLTCRPIGGSLNGSCDSNGYIIGDDLCSGIEEALSVERMRSLWLAVDNNYLPRALPLAKKLWMGTRWTKIDPQGIRIDLLQNDPIFKNINWKIINIPALDPVTDESNFKYDFDVGFSTEFFKQRRASFEHNNDLASWFAQFQGMPVDRDGLVFNAETFRFFNGVLPDDVEPDRKFMVVDPAWGGGDFVAAPIIYQYGEDLYMVDVVYDNSAKDITQPLIVAAVKKYGINAMKVEGTKMTASYGEDIDKKLRQDGIRINIQINTKHFTGDGKRQRILDKASEIRDRFVFLAKEKRPKPYDMFMSNVYSFTGIGKQAKHDDAADSLAMACQFAFSDSVKAEIFKRFW